MTNEEVMKKNGGRRFDVVLQNPPYGATGNSATHLQFVDKCLELANKQVVIFPFTFITKLTNKVQNKYKEHFDKYLISVEEVDSKLFSGTFMPNTGIYVFDSDKSDDEHIEIQRLNQEMTAIKSLLDMSSFNEYEQNIVKYLKEQGQQKGQWAGGHSHCTKSSLAKQGITEPKLVNKLIEDDVVKNTKGLPTKNTVYMVCPNANFPIKFISGRYGNIYDNYDDLIDYLKETKTSSGFNILFFNTVKEAENCKVALQNPLLRFTLFRLKDDQNMTYGKCYIYIPSIDWEDDRVKTDEGLLEVCGCPKEKCKEYAEYCKKIIDKLDAEK